MATTLEIKYFNSFVLKKSYNSNTLTPIWNGSFGIPKAIGGFNRSTSIDPDKSWIIEEARIRGGYNNTSTDYGVRAYLVEEEPNASIRFNSMIYSGIYNSRTGINQTNVFSIAEDITPPSIGAAILCITSLPTPVMYIIGASPARIAKTVMSFGLTL